MSEMVKLFDDNVPFGRHSETIVQLDATCELPSYQGD